jgi:hypothetical protein
MEPAKPAHAEYIEEARTDVFAAASRLRGVATAILTLMVFVSALIIVGGVVGAVVANSGAARVSGLFAVVGGVVTLLFTLLVCFAAQAFARYLEFRAMLD